MRFKSLFLLLALFLGLSPVFAQSAATDTVAPYFLKPGPKMGQQLQRYFKKTFKRPQGVNYDTAAKITVKCVILADGTLISPELDADVQTYTTVEVREHTKDVHGTSATNYSYRGDYAATQQAMAREPEILKKAVFDWLISMPAWTPGTVNGQPAALPVTFMLRF